MYDDNVNDDNNYDDEDDYDDENEQEEEKKDDEDDRSPYRCPPIQPCCNFYKILELPIY